ncbi:2-dehydropantoate 2-reductase [Metabacillus bambusae]|uniref:2-dehydropantoate 2-reductase n=1 Tax=Metabacillus bambusae TaxID=2795218 RepID=A0ABS3MWY0_9BACI|nr:2-dehydropantoate 2-reductase [Metabacillus bambusae]MBO1510528.1 2-dehydropantoate 2-reductase [Metabacillus bambusae]
MDIGIIGAGSLGLLYSYYLCKNHTITLYTNRKAQADQINTNGLLMIKDGIHTRVMINADSTRNYKEELLIVTVKQYDIASVIAEINNLSPRTILFLQNGMGHLPYLSALLKHHIILGIVEHGALRLDDHTVQHTGVGTTKIAYYNRDNSQNTLIEQLETNRQSLFSIEMKDDWREMLAEKLVVNATINPLTSILRVRNGELIENDHFIKLLKALFIEVIQVLGLSNKELLWEHVQNICKTTAQNQSSMYKDIQNGHQTEIDSILGYLIQQATNTQKPIPHITFLYHAIKGIEVGND